MKKKDDDDHREGGIGGGWDVLEIPSYLVFFFTFSLDNPQFQALSSSAHLISARRGGSCNTNVHIICRQLPSRRTLPCRRRSCHNASRASNLCYSYIIQYIVYSRR